MVICYLLESCHLLTTIYFHSTPDTDRHQTPFLRSVRVALPQRRRLRRFCCVYAQLGNLSDFLAIFVAKENWERGFVKHTIQCIYIYIYLIYTVYVQTKCRLFLGAIHLETKKPSRMISNRQPWYMDAGANLVVLK